MKFFPIVFAAMIGSAVAIAQPADGLLTPPQTTEQLDRSAQLLESSQATIPNLARSAGPISEDAKQALAKLKLNNRPLPSELYAYLLPLRSYLSLADALPKPIPFPDESRKQFTDLRTATEMLETHFRALLVRTEAQIRPVDRDNLRRYAPANAKLNPPDPAKPRVLFMGDSITDAWRLAEYFPDKDYVNRGISGQITGEMLGRMQADVIVNKPQAMIVLAGTNDLARNITVETIKNNITMMSELAEAHKIKVILASVLPVSDHHMEKNPRYEMTKIRPPAKIREINSWMADYAKQKGFIYCNYYDALVDPSNQLKAELAPDGLHPNAEGYKLMAPLAQAAIERALAPDNSVQQKGGKKRPTP